MELLAAILAAVLIAAIDIFSAEFHSCEATVIDKSLES